MPRPWPEEGTLPRARLEQVIREGLGILGMARSPRKTCKISDLLVQGSLIIGDGYRAKNAELGTSGLPFARAGNISQGFHFSAADHLASENIVRAGEKISRPGDTVFTSKGTVGRFAFVRIDTPTFVYSPQLCYWRVLDDREIHPRFLFYWMHGQEFFSQFNAVRAQTDMADYVNLRDQRQMHITLPPLLEQRAIAAILGALDDKIELNRRMNQTLESIAQALFKSWFVDFDPVRAKLEGRQPTGIDAETAALFPDSFEDSELGEIPASWEVVPLDQVADFLNGLALQNYPPTGDGYLPVIKIAELHRGVTESSGRASPDIDNKYIVEDGDLLFSWSGSLEVYLWTGGRGALNQHLFKVTSGHYPKWFCYLWTREHLSEFRQIAAGKATTMGHIQRHHLSAAFALVPSRPLLTAMTKVMGPTLDQVVGNLVESRTLAAIRDALLPRLLSGEIRVRDVEGTVQ